MEKGASALSSNERGGVGLECNTSDQRISNKSLFRDWFLAGVADRLTFVFCVVASWEWAVRGC